jgi:hypothetical protein
MKALLAALLTLVMCFALTGCSTHRKELEREAAPEGTPTRSTGEVANMTVSLLESDASQMDVLSSEALAPLTEAASIAFKRSGSTRAFALTRQFANGLLAAAVTRAGVSGFFGASSGSVPQAGITASSGLALADAYEVTKESSYREAALAAARDVMAPALGWVSSPVGVGVASAPGGRRPNVAMTANAALLLKRAGELGAPGAFADYRAALHTVYTSQAAVGRWYRDVGGHLPMSLGEWGTTLFELSADGSKESLGILGAGVPALYANAFEADGQLKQNSETEGQPIAVALALRALAAYAEGGLADNAFGALIEHRRPNGTINLAASDDTVSQAYFGLAFAQWLAGAQDSK